MSVHYQTPDWLRDYKVDETGSQTITLYQSENDDSLHIDSPSQPSESGLKGVRETKNIFAQFWYWLLGKQIHPKILVVKGNGERVVERRCYLHTGDVKRYLLDKLAHQEKKELSLDAQRLARSVLVHDNSTILHKLHFTYDVGEVVILSDRDAIIKRYLKEALTSENPFSTNLHDRLVSLSDRITQMNKYIYSGKCPELSQIMTNYDYIMSSYKEKWEKGERRTPQVNPKVEQSYLNCIHTSLKDIMEAPSFDEKRFKEMSDRLQTILPNKTLYNLKLE